MKNEEWYTESLVRYGLVVKKLTEPEKDAVTKFLALAKRV